MYQLDFLSLVHIHVLVYLVTFLQVSWCTVLWLPSPCWHCYSWSCPPKNLNYIHDCFYTHCWEAIFALAQNA